MIKAKANLANNGQPFPDERSSQALSEEDAFMALHGSFGARAIYSIVGWPIAVIQGLIVLRSDAATRLAGMHRPSLPQKEQGTP